MKAGTNNLTASAISLVTRTSLLLMLGLASINHAKAQTRLGILGGLHSANVIENNHLPGWDTAVKPFQSSRSGYQIGVIAEVPIGHKGFFFQPAVTYATKGRQYTKTNDSLTSALTDTTYAKSTLSLGYIDVPLNITYKIPISTKNKRNTFFISAGPVASFFYNGKVTSQTLAHSTNKYSGSSVNVTVGKGPNTYNTVDLGVNAKAGFEFSNVFLSAYFSQGLSSFYNAPYQGTFHHRLFGASLGIWLSSTAPPPPPPAKDTDKDGVPDDQDLCPLQPGTVKWHGCPVPDSDHDGIDNEHDSCPNVPGLARYNGCPVPDTDNDGVDNEHDSCPTVPGLARYNGCPIPDRDGDGVNDEVDKCPDTPGTPANNGCPVVKEEIKPEIQEKINFTAHNIQFTRGSDRMLDTSEKSLIELSAILIAHPNWYLTIAGFTDNTGSPQRNLTLSHNRAFAVRDFLIRRGVRGNQLTATGLGQERPIADNSTEEGRAANRRVELRLEVKK